MQERTPLEGPEAGIGERPGVSIARARGDWRRRSRLPGAPGPRATAGQSIGAAAAIAILTAAAALVWRPRPGTVTVDRVMVVHEQEKPAAPPRVTLVSDTVPVGNEFAAAAYLRLRDALAQNGLQSLPATAAGEGNDAAVLCAGSRLDGPVAAGFRSQSHHTFIRGG